jgi:copper chaperone
MSRIGDKTNGSKRKAIIKIEGMTCEYYKIRVRTAIMALEGVSSVSVDLAGGRADVTYDSSKISLDTIKKAILDAGIYANIKYMISQRS